ncbi:MAG: acyl-CoA thioesterase [Acidimicrobiia bacterium]
MSQTPPDDLIDPTHVDEVFAADCALMAITATGPDTFSVALERRLCRPDAMMYGGHAAAIAAVALERTSGRQLVWCTSQFLSSASAGVDVTVQVTEAVRGRRSSQLTVATTDPDGTLLFTAMGATVDRHAFVGGLTGQFSTMPQVTEPETCRRLFPVEIVGELGWHTTLDIRLATVAADGDPSRLCFWIRFADGGSMTAARIAYAVDMVPMAVARAAGAFRGRSLDNTFRPINVVPCEWVLADFRPHAVWGGYGSGEVLVWSRDGMLLAIESQSTFVFEGGSDPFG